MVAVCGNYRSSTFFDVEEEEKTCLNMYQVLVRVVIGNWIETLHWWGKSMAKSFLPMGRQNMMATLQFTIKTLMVRYIVTSL